MLGSVGPTHGSSKMAFDTTMNGALEANDGPLRVRLVSYELTLNKPSTGNEQKTPVSQSVSTPLYRAIQGPCP